MYHQTIIFINGWSVPQFIAQSPWVWNAGQWSEYKTIWLSSKTPTSDRMVKDELDRLQNLIEIYPGCTLAGHSLGAWWASNLALRPNVTIRKMVLWTALGNTKAYPIFNVSKRYYPMSQPPTNTHGPHRVLSFIGTRDLIVPPKSHADKLNDHFNGMAYQLYGGHFFQSNHAAGLKYMKDWIET